MPFHSDVLKVSSYGPTLWLLDAPVHYQGKHEQFEVPAEFCTDFASVPTICTWLIPRYGVYTRAAVLHDYLCQEAHVGRFNRADADGIFRRCLRELGVSFTRRWLMWAAVRAGGLMSGAGARDWLLVLLIALVALPLLALPVLVICVWALLFWLLELLDRGRPVTKMEPPEYV